MVDRPLDDLGRRPVLELGVQLGQLFVVEGADRRGREARREKLTMRFSWVTVTRLRTRRHRPRPRRARSRRSRRRTRGRPPAWEHVELLELGGDGLGPAGPVDPVAERLAGRALVRRSGGRPAPPPRGRSWPAGAGPSRRSGSAPGRRSRRAASGSRGRAAVGPALGAEEADVGRVVLAAAVGAARDVDPQPADLGQALLLQPVADGGAEAAALGDGQVAGVGAGQVTTSRTSSAPGSAMPMASSRW